MSYILFRKLIEAGKTIGLAEKADVMYTLGRLTDEQYTEIMNKLGEGAD